MLTKVTIAISSDAMFPSPSPPTTSA